uniref:Uncharacterized protein n=1 Tax=Cacopsylla melanoneura TaxID=428564 RepID=A0A8D9ALG2_9HEMI
MILILYHIYIIFHRTHCVCIERKKSLLRHFLFFQISNDIVWNNNRYFCSLISIYFSLFMLCACACAVCALTSSLPIFVLFILLSLSLSIIPTHTHGYFSIQ